MPGEFLEGLNANVNFKQKFPHFGCKLKRKTITSRYVLSEQFAGRRFKTGDVVCGQFVCSSLKQRTFITNETYFILLPFDHYTGHHCLSFNR